MTPTLHSTCVTCFLRINNPISDGDISAEMIIVINDSFASLEARPLAILIKPSAGGHAVSYRVISFKLGHSRSLDGFSSGFKTEVKG